MIRMSEHRRIIYELRPGLPVTFMDRAVTMNPEGFRGPLYLPDKGKDTVRILGLGDSIMFGWGVGDGENYLSLLSGRLSDSFPQLSWEIINTAVPGYNTVMEVETLKKRGMRYDPDIVIVHYVGNDLSLPNFIVSRENYFSLKKSFFLELVLLHLRGDCRMPGFRFVNAPSAARGDGFEDNPRNVPEEYSDMVGLEAYRRAMRELKLLSAEHGFDVLILSHGTLPEFVKNICGKSDFHCVDAGPAMKEFMRVHGISRFRGSILAISKDDHHPSALGHKIIADVVYTHIAGSDRVRKLIKKQ